MQGIVYASGECPPFPAVRPWVEDNRLVVCADGGYDRARAHNMAVDVVVGDFDSIQNVDAIPHAIPRISFPSDKAHTDTELAIAHCKERGCASLLLIGGGGGDVDHFLALVWLFEGENRVDRWITERAMIEYVDVSWRRENCAPGETISVLPVGRGPWQMQSRGLRWALQDHHWQRHITGIRNQATENSVSITVATGALLVIQKL